MHSTTPSTTRIFDRFILKPFFYRIEFLTINGLLPSSTPHIYTFSIFHHHRAVNESDEHFAHLRSSNGPYNLTPKPQHSVKNELTEVFKFLFERFSSLFGFLECVVVRVSMRILEPLTGFIARLEIIFRSIRLCSTKNVRDTKTRDQW